MRIFKILFVGVLAMLVAACSKDVETKNAVNKDEFVSSKLALVKIIHKDKEYLANKDAYMELSKDGVNGTSGCNRFFGKAVYSDDSVTFENVASTKMYCHNYDFEDVFFMSLTKLNIANHGLSDGNVMLYNDDFTLIVKPLN